VALYDFAIGDPDEPTPEHIQRALKDAVGPVSRYPTAAGQPALRAAVAAWFARRHGVTVDPDTEVVPSSGSKEAIFHLPLAVLDPQSPRRHVLWGDPGYPTYASGAVFAGGVSDPVTLSAEGAGGSR
jgi:aspartate/methionine/tyrosine aminotransferase